MLLAAAPLIVFTSFAFFKSSAHHSLPNQTSKLPQIMLWAWERPERFDHVDGSRVGIAFLASTLYLRGEEVVVRPRLQPLNVTSQSTLVAVVRIESDRHDRPHLTEQQLDQTVAGISRVTSLPKVVAIQIDFDATLSERKFYRELLFAIREAVPRNMGLSMTALASWCSGDNWLEDLPVDEAVPMLFRMGTQENLIREQLASGKGFASTKCQSSLGLSTDEPLTGLPRARRTYFFNPRSWTAHSVDELLKHHEAHSSYSE